MWTHDYQWPSMVITPRRFGDLFVYDDGGFDRDFEDFFGRRSPMMSPLGEELNSVNQASLMDPRIQQFDDFSVPIPDFNNRFEQSVRLLHGADNPIMMRNGDSYHHGKPFPSDLANGDRNRPYSPTLATTSAAQVRHIPITVERARSEQPPSSFSNGRKTPPPPTFLRRTFVVTSSDESSNSSVKAPEPREPPANLLPARSYGGPTHDMPGSRWFGQKPPLSLPSESANAGRNRVIAPPYRCPAGRRAPSPSRFNGINVNGSSSSEGAPSVASASGIGLSPVTSGSDRSSSLSEDSFRSSSSAGGGPTVYDVPPPPVASRVAQPSNNRRAFDDDKLTSSLLNVLDELYQTPRSQPRLTNGVDGRDFDHNYKRPGADYRGENGVLGSYTTSTGTLTRRAPAPYSYTKENLPFVDTPSSMSSGDDRPNSPVPVLPSKATSFKPEISQNQINQEPGPRNGAQGSQMRNGYKAGTNGFPQEEISTYDVPPSSRKVHVSAENTNGYWSAPPTNNNLSISDRDQRLSVSSVDSRDSDYQTLLEAKEVNLSHQAAMDVIESLHQNIQTVVDKLTAFIGKNWRRKDVFETKLFDVKHSCRQTITNVNELLSFCSGAFVHTVRVANDEQVSKRLAHLLRPIRNSLSMLRLALDSLDAKKWNLNDLVREPTVGNDSLDQFIAIAKEIPEDSRQVASFIKGHSVLMFPKPTTAPNPTTSSTNKAATINGDAINGACKNPQSRPLPSVPPNSSPPQNKATPSREQTLTPPQADPQPLYATITKKSSPSPGPTPALERNAIHESEYETETDGENSLMDDYDFIDSSRNGSSGQAALSVNGNCVPNGNSDLYHVPPKPRSNSSPSALSKMKLEPEDVQILQFYAPQVKQHMQCLCNSIDKFLQTIEHNEPPAMFIGQSKFVVLAAHKLVYIGDSINQCLKHEELAGRVKHCADGLCEILKQTVVATKQASLQFPAVPCVQAMVDCMVNVSHSAHELKLLICEATPIDRSN